MLNKNLVACQPFNSLFFFFFFPYRKEKKNHKITEVGKHIRNKNDIVHFSISFLLTTMSYFDKKRKYTEIYSQTERSRGYLEEKVNPFLLH